MGVAGAVVGSQGSADCGKTAGELFVCGQLCGRRVDPVGISSGESAAARMLRHVVVLGGKAGTDKFTDNVGGVVGGMDGGLVGDSSAEYRDGDVCHAAIGTTGEFVFIDDPLRGAAGVVCQTA